MVAATDESIIVRMAIWAGIGSLLLTALFLFAAFATRAVVGRREGRKKEVEGAWLPPMLASLRDTSAACPTLRRRDAARVLALWIRLITPIEGEAIDRLRSFARRANFPAAARRLVRKGNPQERLVAAVFLGEQQDLASVRVLQELAEQSELVVRVEAARALVRIDPVSGARFAAPLLARWEDCHPAMAVVVLEPAPTVVAAGALAGVALATKEPPQQARLIEALGAFQAPIALRAIRQVLEATNHPEVIARCLAALRDYRKPADARLVRRFLRHQESFVRVQAVATLGRLQIPGDEWSLYSCLADADWWVRYRAAHALIGFRGVSPALRELMTAVHPDRYGRDALEQAMSEQELD